jgi:hypothetical protein
LTVTVQRCVTPGTKVFAPGRVSLTLPVDGFKLTEWQDAQGIPVPGSPEFPAGILEPFE